MAVKGGYLAITAGGGILLWSGLTGRKWTSVIRNILSGHPPASAMLSYPITPGFFTPSTSSGILTIPGSASESAIASDALSHNGQPYTLGGHPNRDWSGRVDCSSFVNGVIGMDLGMKIPGFKAGTYDGSTHGPNTVAWLASIGTTTVKIPRVSLGAGDIACWQTHMGIAISNNQMISAQNPANGTRISPITGFIQGEILVCLRLKALTR